MVAHILWIGVVILNLALLASSIQAFIAILQSGCTTVTCHALIPPYSARQIQAAGFSFTFYVTYVYVVQVLFWFAFLTIGAIIFWLKSHDFMALYTSFALVTFAVGFNSTTLVAFVPAWWLPIQTIAFFGSVLFGTFFYLFPNGRFVPRWTLWLLGGWVFYSAVEYFFSNSLLDKSWLITLVFLCLLVSVLVSQVYRYRYVSTQGERQQTKWVVFGLSIGLVGFALVLFFYFNNALSLFQPNPLSDLLAGTAVNLFILLIPSSIAFAILRSRLWNIDIIIKRTLVYGILTFTLALIYAGLVIGLGSLIRLITGQLGQSRVAIVVSTLVIAALFQPLRHRLQRFIDHRFYRHKYDAAKTLETFSKTLRNEVDLNQLREELVAIVKETMQPAHVSLWLRQPTRKESSSHQSSEIQTQGTEAQHPISGM